MKWLSYVMLSPPLYKRSSRLLVGSKDLFWSLSSHRNSTDKSVRGDVNEIRLYHETFVDLFGWIRGTTIRTKVGTNVNSPLVEAFALIVAI